MFFQSGSSKSHTNRPSSEAVGDHSPLQFDRAQGTLPTGEFRSIHSAAIERVWSSYKKFLFRTSPILLALFYWLFFLELHLLFAPTATHSYSFIHPLKPAAIFENNDYIPRLTIEGFLTPSGHLRVKEVLDVRAFSLAGQSNPVRIFPANRLRKGKREEGRKYFSITSRSLEIEVSENGKDFLPMGGVGVLQNVDMGSAVGFRFGDTSLGAGFHRYKFEYEIENFEQLALESGHVYFEIGPRYSIPIEQASMSLYFESPSLLPEKKEAVGNYPIIGLEQFSGTDKMVPEFVSSLFLVSGASASISSINEGGWILSAELQKGLAANSRLVLDYDLKGSAL